MIPQQSSSFRVAIAWCRLVTSLLIALLLFGAAPAGAVEWASLAPLLRSFFPQADSFTEPEGTPPSVAVLAKGETVGYALLSIDAVKIPAYSGKPITTLIGLDLRGRIVGLRIVHHEEPILGVGITQERLDSYVAQYQGKSAFDKIVIGGERPGHITVDGISGATITVMVQNASVMRAAKLVAEARGIKPEEVHAATVGAQAPAPTAAPQAEMVAPRATGQAEAGPPAAGAIEAAPAGTPPAQPAAATRGKTAKPQERRAKPREVLPAPEPALIALPPLDGQLEKATRPVSSLVFPLLFGRASTDAQTAMEPDWTVIWRGRSFDIAVLMGGLILLSFVLVFQDWLARDPQLLTRVRLGFHIYTLFFIGWWGLAQLSVINVLTFVSSVMHGFRWESFLIDPMLFILWGFVAVTLLLWGRGVYCGWLCPFGALQELVQKVARRFKVPEIEFSDAVHERLVALKYIVLILIFGVSLQSIAQAAWYAEVEPFKTVITMRFQREWQYVLYALVLIGLAAVNRKFYCKYVCPLGAALAIPGRFRLFEWWLRRRKECGKPCQVCAKRCPVGAIRTTGEINANECHYCLDCQVIYYNDQVCLPLIDRRKRREAQMQRVKAATAEAAEAAPAPLAVPNSGGSVGKSSA